MFAKLFDTKEFGQLLVTLELNDEEQPTLVFRIENNGFSISPSVVFSDDDEGFDKRDKLLEEMDEAKAVGFVTSAIPASLKRLLGLEEDE